MEALTCGNTEVAPQDLRIMVNKLSRDTKSCKNAGFGEEFKVIEDYSTFHMKTLES